MRVDEKWEIIQNDITVDEFTKDLVVPVSERKKRMMPFTLKSHYYKSKT